MCRKYRKFTRNKCKILQQCWAKIKEENEMKERKDYYKGKGFASAKIKRQKKQKIEEEFE